MDVSHVLEPLDRTRQLEQPALDERLGFVLSHAEDLTKVLPGTTDLVVAHALVEVTPGHQREEEGGGQAEEGLHDVWGLRVPVEDVIYPPLPAKLDVVGGQYILDGLGSVELVHPSSGSSPKSILRPDLAWRFFYRRQRHTDEAGSVILWKVAVMTLDCPPGIPISRILHLSHVEISSHV